MIINNDSAQPLLAPTQSEGKLLVRESRIRDVKAARKVNQRMKTADDNSSKERAKIQALIDGQPPYNQAELEQNGLADICNVNWGDAERLLQNALAPRIDMLESVETICTMPTNFGDPQMRHDWETVMAEEFTRLYRTLWTDYNATSQYLLQQILVNGVAVAFFENERDFRWRVSPLGDFRIPRNTRASDDCIEVWAITRSVPPHELYGYIEDEEIAKEVGWNVAAVKSALLNATSSKTDTGKDGEWELLQREFKNNDIGMSGDANASEVKIVFMGVRELDGSITSLAFVEEEGLAGKDDGFLYKKERRYQNVSQALVTFCSDIGTNGYFHSIRGMGSKIFSIASAMNQMRCSFYDSLRMAALQPVKAESEEALENLSFISTGPFQILPPGLDYIEREVPNFNQSMIPGLQDLDTLMQKAAGIYSSEAAFNASRERTRYEVQAQVETLANISLASQNLFYQPWERLVRETARRVIQPDYLPEDPGGELVLEFKLRCLERGVPEEAIYAVDVSRVKAVRALGNGSASARMTQMRQILELAPQYDPHGQALVRRDITRMIGGVEMADRYTPPPEQPRPPTEAKTALLENNQFTMGLAVPVLPSEMHSIHLPIHMDKEEELVQAIDSGAATMEEVGPMLVQIHAHATEHASFMVADPSFPQIKQRLQQLDGIIFNVTKHLEDLERDKVQAQQNGELPPNVVANDQANAANPSGAADTLQRQLIQATTEMAIREQEHQQQLRQKEEAHRQNLAIKDAEAAANIARKAISA